MSYKQMNIYGIVEPKKIKPKNILTEEQKKAREIKGKAHMAFKKFKASGWSDRLLSDEEKHLVKTVYGF